MDCPTCGESFDSKQGMRIHHGHKHGETLPNRTCKDCGVDFYDAKSRRSYCEDCNPNAGTNNGNWSGAKKAGKCRNCESEFSYYPSDKRGIYCSKCVKRADGLLPDNPAEKVRIQRKCA